MDDLFSDLAAYRERLGAVLHQEMHLGPVNPHGHGQLSLEDPLSVGGPGSHLNTEPEVSEHHIRLRGVGCPKIEPDAAVGETARHNELSPHAEMAGLVSQLPEVPPFALEATRGGSMQA
ncbi:MAG: hypothetical protein M3Y49_10710 [Actinomycetota bacterium]|nr:hypothetical protein [Actinomycetota bacterium]